MSKNRLEKAVKNRNLKAFVSGLSSTAGLFQIMPPEQAKKEVTEEKKPEPEEVIIYFFPEKILKKKFGHIALQVKNEYFSYGKGVGDVQPQNFTDALKADKLSYLSEPVAITITMNSYQAERAKKAFQHRDQKYYKLIENNCAHAVLQSIVKSEILDTTKDKLNAKINKFTDKIDKLSDKIKEAPQNPSDKKKQAKYQKMLKKHQKMLKSLKLYEHKLKTKNFIDNKTDINKGKKFLLPRKVALFANKIETINAKLERDEFRKLAKEDKIPKASIIKFIENDIKQLETRKRKAVILKQNKKIAALNPQIAKLKTAKANIENMSPNEKGNLAKEISINVIPAHFELGQMGLKSIKDYNVYIKDIHEARLNQKRVTPADKLAVAVDVTAVKNAFLKALVNDLDQGKGKLRKFFPDPEGIKKYEKSTRGMMVLMLNLMKY